MTSNKTASFKTNAAAMSSDSAPTALAAQPFRLLDLPDELWARIGKMVINDLPIQCISSGPGPEAPAILQTCSALRNELRLEYYGAKLQILVHHRLDLSIRCHSLGEYLRAIGADARRCIKIVVPGGDAFKTTILRFLSYELELLEEAWVGVEFEVHGKFIEGERVSEGIYLVEWTISFL
ncbi:unnamed protein product [Zymoseptoria tritici ST99CH_3D1]|nr:unnamed protein product [Zymoseptoria tritici ST99CH_3D1]